MNGHTARASLRRFLLLVWLATSCLSGSALATELPAAVDLRNAAQQSARDGRIVIILFSRAGCAYCEAIRRDYLNPQAISPRFRDRVVVLQVNQDSDARLIDFRGEVTTHARFTLAEGRKLVPVLAFHGPDGRRLAPAIVGLRLSDFYQSYLDEAIETSLLALATAVPDGRQPHSR